MSDKLKNLLAILFCVIFAISVGIYYFVSMAIGGWMAGLTICLGISYMLAQSFRYAWITIKQLSDQIDSLKK